MRARILLPFACLLAGLAVAAPAHAQAPTPTPPVDTGDFQVEFGTFKKANQSVASLIRRSGAVEAVANEINSRWALPVNVPVLVTDSNGDVGPAFIPDVALNDGTKTDLINVPGSFLRLEYQAMKAELRGGDSGITPREATVSATQFVLAHEMGHALVHELKLPITGREEDAVDGFAAYLLADNPKFGPLTAFSAALFFDALSADSGALSDADFADEHSINQQRTYQFLCWVYGSDTKRFKSLVGPDLLPKSRAVQCPAEWQQVKTSWDILLTPYALATPPVR
jgi:hypothetical protein